MGPLFGDRAAFVREGFRAAAFAEDTFHHDHARLSNMALERGPTSALRSGEASSGEERRVGPRLVGPRLSVLTVGVAAFAVYHLALAIFMAGAPHAFYTDVGPFGARNDHYIRDVATYNAAIGMALLIAVRCRSWRVPVLALTTIQFALHSVNHLVDIGNAHPSWNGYVDFFSLAASALLLALLLRSAAREVSGAG